VSPDAPTTLASERTHLAWRRTALGLTAGAVTAAHLLQPYLGGAAWSVAAAGAIVAAALAAASRRRNVGPSVGRIDGLLVSACTGGLVLLGVGAVAYIVLAGT